MRPGDQEPRRQSGEKGTHSPVLSKDTSCAPDLLVSCVPSPVMLLISSSRFQEHTTPPGHPERPERAEVFDQVAAAWREGGGRVVEPRPATREELLRVH